jgi:predicted DsbA family dithiol-disulfide isomerase
MSGRVQALAAEVGLVMRTPEWMVNSRLALASAEFARERGAFDAVHRALFRVHWEGPGRLDDVGELKRVAADAGLDARELEEALSAGSYEEVLDAHRREATAVGINAIPAHIFGRRYLVVGAYPLQVYEQVLAQLSAES